MEKNKDTEDFNNKPVKYDDKGNIIHIPGYIIFEYMDKPAVYFN